MPPKKRKTMAKVVRPRKTSSKSPAKPKTPLPLVRPSSPLSPPPLSSSPTVAPITSTAQDCTSPPCSTSHDSSSMSPIKEVASSTTTLVNPPISNDQDQEPKEKRKWSASVSDSSDDDDVLPDIGDLLRRAVAGDLSPSPPETGEATGEETEVEYPENQPVFKPTQLPAGVYEGSAIYVKPASHWYMGYLKKFIPAETRHDKQRRGDKYLVVDRYSLKERFLTRGRILFSTDDGFATCRLTPLEITYKDFDNDARTRQPTPSMAGPSTPPTTGFSDLDREEQLGFLRSHMQAIISETYQPAQWRINDFYNNSQTRNKLVQYVKYGDISEEEVSAVIVPELERWAMRGERWHGNITTEPRPEEPPRPIGSERYESLSLNNRRTFTSNVLLPEVIIQLCILCDELSHPTPQDPPTAQEPPTPQEVYETARELLAEYAADNDTAHWSFIVQECNDVRRKVRKRLGLPPENMSELVKTSIEASDYDAKIEAKYSISHTGRLVPKSMRVK